MQRSDNIEIYIYTRYTFGYRKKKLHRAKKYLFIPPHRINTNNAFNNRSDPVEITGISVCLSRIRLRYDIPVARLNGLNKRPRFNICDGGTIVMKIEWIGARRSLSSRVVHAREGTKEEERRNGVSKRPDDETWKNSTPLPTPKPAFRGGDPTHRARRHELRKY